MQDVDLVFANCLLYNGTISEVGAFGVRLNTMWRSEWTASGLASALLLQRKDMITKTPFALHLIRESPCQCAPPSGSRLASALRPHPKPCCRSSLPLSIVRRD